MKALTVFVLVQYAGSCIKKGFKKGLTGAVKTQIQRCLSAAETGV